MTHEAEYVLGTHDEEVERLGLQHRVWRSRVRDVWQRAGFAAGHTVLDVGCGPGYAALDLASLVGPHGCVHALDRSRRFLDVLESRARGKGLAQVRTHAVDFDAADLPEVTADAAWLRWILAFVKEPRVLLERVAARVRPGGTLVIHEYADYRTWRTLPPVAELDEFVSVVMASWRAARGEPDIGLWLPAWLESLGFIVTIRPLVDVVSPGDPIWLWLRSFVHGGRRRLVEGGALSEQRSDAIWSAFAALEQRPTARMMSPTVLEIIASR